MNFVRSNKLSLKDQRFIPLGRKDIGIRKVEFMAKPPFLINHFCRFVSIKII